MIKFITVPYTVGIAADILRQEKLDQPPTEEADVVELANKIVNRVWRQLPMENVADIMDAVCSEFENEYCICKSGIYTVRTSN